MAVLTLVVPGAAACSGASAPSSAAASAPAGGSGASAGFFQQALAYAQCMRAHGVANFPDPNWNGGAQPLNLAGIDTNSPTYKTAVQACRQYAPPGENNPNLQAQARTQALKFAQCMRAHGEPKFPDPSNSGGQQSITQYGIDPNTPTFKAANEACQGLLSSVSDGGS